MYLLLRIFFIPVAIWTGPFECLFVDTGRRYVISKQVVRILMDFQHL